MSVSQSVSWSESFALQESAVASKNGGKCHHFPSCPSPLASSQLWPELGGKQKHKLWQNSKTQIVTVVTEVTHNCQIAKVKKLKLWQNLKPKIVTTQKHKLWQTQKLKLWQNSKNWNCDKTLKLKLWRNSNSKGFDVLFSSSDNRSLKQTNFLFFCASSWHYYLKS